MTRILPVAIFIAAVLSLSTACGAGSTSAAPPVAHVGSAPSASPSPGSAQLSPSEKQRLWLQFANCLREHGADEPDPTFDSNGNPQWAVNIKGLPQAPQRACAPILQSLNLGTGQRADPARIAALTRFAQCIRQHGLADFPDPDSAGNFQTNGDPTLEPGWAAAYQACSGLQPKTKG
ncbi:MAG TPA: hypothetical protein VKK19_09015 [Candidatus Dormibacteraeota bacterium]|nr:hypothetical protein [Candidatus Dormibacteraeota bacterium]